MQYMVVGIFQTYTEAEGAVQDLELAGVVGEQVEVISDIDEDVRTANISGEPSTKSHEPHHSRLARLFAKGGPLETPEVRDLPGEQPNYIGQQEFYANHLKQGGAVIIVRTSGELTGRRAAEILRDRGAHTPGSKDDPIVRRIN